VQRQAVPDGVDSPFTGSYLAAMETLCVQEIAAEPLAALAALRRLPLPFLLHSSLPGPHARWSLFGADPFAVERGDDPAAVARLWTRFAPHLGPGPRVAPFQGGVVGYRAYEAGAGDRGAAAGGDTALPNVVAAAYDVVGAIDHATGRAWLFSSGLPAHGPAAAVRARERLAAFARRLSDAATAARDLRPVAALPPREARASQLQRLASSMTPERYRRAIARVQEHIRRGDIFQANLSQRWTYQRPLADATPDLPLALAARLAERSPAPFAAFLDAGDHAIVSASPERFLALRSGVVEARPIKGTRPRGHDPLSDRAHAAALLASAKDRAENVMIVDVLRNDIGRVCEWGSVAVPELCTLEAYPQVWHLTSAVTGRLRAGQGPFDLLDACFPGGSITGAPKLRAIEILAGLEPVSRHIYTGAIGYVDWNGDADWNIAIRTAVVTPRAVQFSAGGGITAESDSDAEYDETLHKAEGLRAALSDVVGPLELGSGTTAGHTAGAGP
jgi:para-aminobenzoate synthetase component I